MRLSAHMKLVLAVAMGALGVASTAAHADSHSWAAIKGTVSPKLTIAVSVDFVPMRKLATFNTMVSKLIASNGEVAKGLDLMKSSCQLDVTSVVTDISVIVDENKKGAVAIGFDGTDRGAIEACLAKLANTNKDGKTITHKEVGGVTEYTASGETDKLRLKWIGKNAVILSTEPTDAKALKTALVKTNAKSPLSKLIAKTNTASPAWFAIAISKDIEQGIKMTGASGQVDITTDKLTVAARMSLSTADAATKVVAEATAAMPQLAKQVAKAPDLAKVVASAKIAADGSDVTATASAAVASLPALIQQIMSM